MGRIKTTRRGGSTKQVVSAHADTSSKRPLLHLSDRIFGPPLMIHQNKLRVVLEEIGGRLDPISYQSALDALLPSLEPGIGPLAALSLREPSDRKSYAVTDSGIAIIPIEGMLMKKSTWMSSWSGMCTYEDIGEQFAEALADSTVRAVLFDVDSPGGETHGCFELTDQIYQARGQGKLIYGSANDLAASAAYALLSACDRNFVTRTGAVGSVGVYSMHCSQQEMDKKIGLKYTYISAGERKVDGNPHSDLSETAQAEAQAEVDRQYAIFVTTVARNRGAKESAVIGTKALCFFAENAVPLLADEVGTLEDAVAALESRISTGATTVGLRAPRTISLSQDQLRQLNAGTPVVITPTPTPKEALPMSAPNATALTVEEQLAALQKENAELKAKAAIAAAAPATAAPTAVAAAPGEDCDDDEEDDNPPMQATQQPILVPAAAAQPAPGTPAPKRSGRSAAVIIAELCTMNGADAQCSELIRANAEGKKTVAQIREEFLAKRSAASHANMTSNGHSGGTAGSPLDRMEQMAVTLVANSGGKLSKSKAYETVLKANPMVYRDYVEEKDEAALTPGRRRAYLEQMGPKMAAMGLGSQFVRQ